MASNFNEVDMMVLAKLSYYKVPGGQYRSDGTAIEPYSLSDMMSNSKIDKAMRKEFGDTTVENFLNKIEGQDYKVVKAIDNTYDSGFEGIAIEGPDSQTVTVATRGSESHNFEDKVQDWVVADVVGLGMTSESGQQDDMNDFMADLDKYDSIYLTGHSLGGNLAVSGAVNFDDPEKIKGVYTYNAPGQNSAYITTHASGILSVADKITNYQNVDDWVSDINAPIGDVVYVKSNAKDMNAHSLGKFGGYSSGSFATTKSKNLGHYATSLGVNIVTAGLSSMALISGLGGIYLADEIGPALKNVGDWCGEKAKAAGEWIGNAYDDAKEWVGDAVDDIKDGAKAVGKAIAEGAEEVGEAIVDGAKAVGSGISKGAKAVGDGISNAYEYVTGTGRYNNDLIFVNTEGLREEANKMRNYQQEYTNVMQKITNLIITLKQNNIWDAPATTTFIDNYVELKDVFDKFGRVMTEYSSILEGVSERMQTTDNTMSTKFENLSL